MLRHVLTAFAGFAWGCVAAVPPPALPPQGGAEAVRVTCAGADMPAADRFVYAAPQAHLTSQQALDAQSRRGYRLMLANAGHFLFDKLPADVRAPEYLSLTLAHPKGFERQVHEAALRGFRLSEVSDPIMERPRAGLSDGQSDADATRYDYIVVSTAEASLDKFERQIVDATSKGYRPKAVYTIDHYETEEYSLVLDYEEYVVVLESTPDSPSTAAAAAVASETFRVVKFADVRKGTARFRSYVSRGYRITGGDESNVLLRYLPQQGPFEYLVLEPRGHTLESLSRNAQNDMNRAMSRGFRVAADGLFLTFGWSMRLGLVMEKSAEVAPDLEYMVIGVFRGSTLRRRLDEAFAQGFTPVAMKMTGPQFVVLQKPRSRCRSGLF